MKLHGIGAQNLSLRKLKARGPHRCHAGFKLGNVSMAPPVVSAEALTTAPAVSAAPLQPSPASTIIMQTPPAGQKVLAGAVVNFEVR